MSAKSFIQEFKEFALKGNVVDMAVGVIIGGAFGKIVSSLVADIFMPLISLAAGGIDFTNWFVQLGGRDHIYNTLAEAQEAGVAVLSYGNFIQVTFDFIIVALCIFLFIKLMMKATSLAKKKKEEEAAAAPAPEPSAEEKLLTEIRDLLKQQNK